MQTFLNVVLLQIFLKYDAEYCVKELEAIKRAIGKNIYPAMHDKRHLAIVIVTGETPRSLVNRLRGVLDKDAISNYWAIVPNRNVASKDGSLDSLSTRVGMAYATLNQRSKPKNVIQVQARGREHLRKDAPVKVGVEPSRPGKPPKNPNRPYRG